MSRTLVVLVAGAALAFPLASGGQPLGPPPPSQTSPPVGRWAVEFANGVAEVCDIQKDGTASVVEPVRISGGKAVVNGSSVLIVFEGGRVQRWTPVGKRLVVEHWFPGSQFPTAAAGVFGIAERAQ